MNYFLLTVLVCGVAAQYYQQQNQVPTPNQVPVTRFSQYSNNQYGQQQYGQSQYGQPNQYSATSSYNMNNQYGSTAGYNTNNRMYDTQTQRYYNGVSTSSVFTALTAAAVALVL